MKTLTPTFPCYTGHGVACWQRPYEDLLDRLAAKIGMDNARTAFAVIGDDITTQTKRKLLSTLLRAYGNELLNYDTELPRIGEHSRIDGTNPQSGAGRVVRFVRVAASLQLSLHHPGRKAMSKYDKRLAAFSIVDDPYNFTPEQLDKAVQDLQRKLTPRSRRRCRRCQSHIQKVVDALQRDLARDQVTYPKPTCQH